MKKVILYSFLTLCLFANTLKAQEAIDYAEIVNNTEMPTQEEIMEVLNKFEFDEAQKQQLLKETQKKLEELYNNNDFSSLIQGQEILNQQENLQQENSTQPNKQKVERVKKYSNHDPLTRKRDRY